MANPGERNEFRSWGVEGHAIRIEYAVPALEEICANAVDGLLSFRHGGIEVGGVLFGTAAGDRVCIVTYRPLDCEHAFGPRFVLSERDRAAMKDLVYAARREPELRGLEPVGWYHSHTRSGIELSPRDLEIYDSYFPQRWQVALVIQPDNFGPARAGFFFRERDGKVDGARSYAEFTSYARRHALVGEPVAEARPPEEPAGAAPAQHRGHGAASTEGQGTKLGVPSAPTTEPAVPSPTRELPRGQPLEIPEFARTRPWHGHKWIWALLGAVLLSAATLGAVQYYIQSAPSPRLSLWVTDVGGQLLIEWNRSAGPIREAQSATLEIQDGNQRVTKTLDGEALHEGSIDYERISDVVDVRLRLRRHGRDLREAIRFIGQPVRRPPSPEDAAAARQLEELKAQFEAVRAESEAKDTLIRRLRAKLADQ